MIEKESLTHRIEDDMERRNRNWDIIKTHIRNYTEQVGNPANLTTVSKEVVGAVNELKDEIDTNKEELTQHKQDYTEQRQQDQLKVAKVEKELNDYKKVMSQVNINHEAKQTASGYGIISLPKNAANGQVSVSVKGNTVNQLLNYNPDTWGGWTGNEKNVIDGKLTLFGNGVYNYIDFPLALKAGDEIRIVIKFGEVSVDNYTSNIIFLSNVGSSYSVLSPMQSYSNTTIQNNISIQEDISKIRILVSQAAVEGKLEVDYVMLFYANDNYATNWISGDSAKSTIGAKRIKSVGKNLFDGKVEQGTISKVTGKPASSSTYWRTVNFIKVKPNTLYRFKHYNSNRGFTYYLYDADKNLIKSTSWGDTESWSVTTTENTVFMKLVFEQINEQEIKVVVTDRDLPTEYEPYKESTAYVVAKDKDNKIVNLMSHEGVHDEIDLDKRELIKRIGVDEEGLTYQLAEPEIIPIQVSGNIVSNPSGTIYIEPAVADAGVYQDGISIFEQELNIDYIDKLYKIDYKTSVETELDASKCIISEDKKSFTHPDLQNGDIVFFEYYYSNEATQGEATIEYYDSRYTIKDKSTDKFYQWDIEVDNGVPSIKLVEV